MTVLIHRHFLVLYNCGWREMQLFQIGANVAYQKKKKKRAMEKEKKNKKKKISLLPSPAQLSPLPKEGKARQ